MAIASSIRTLVLAAAGAASILAVAPIEAQAGHRHQRHSGGDEFVAGVAGFLLGTAIGGPRQPVYVSPPVVYVEPQPIYPQPVYGQPVYGQPVYGQPVYGQPVYSQPVYSDPGYLSAPSTPYPVYQEPVQRRPYSEIKRNRQYQHDDGPDVITYDETVGGIRQASAAEPWTPGWELWCSSKYRSFDRRSGTFLGYDGNRHFCRVK
ncbi:MAG: BA14K family protein [Rhizobiaceae bacterium]